MQKKQQTDGDKMEEKHSMEGKHFGERKVRTMAGNILRKAGVVLLTILKGILQVFLYLFKFILTVAKVILLLFSMVLRVFLSLFGVSMWR